MKYFMLFIICFFITQLYSQEIKFEKGQKISYLVSQYHTNTYYPNTQQVPYETEGLARKQYKFEVLDISDSLINLQLEVLTKSNYIRSRELGSDNWRTRTANYYELRSKSDEEKNYIKRYSVHMSKQGHIIRLSSLDSFSMVKGTVYDSNLVRHEYILVDGLFQYPQIANSTAQNHSKYEVFDSSNNDTSSYFELGYKSDSLQEQGEISATFNRKDGLVKEWYCSKTVNRPFKRYRFNGSTPTFVCDTFQRKGTEITRAVLLNDNLAPYSCRMVEDVRFFDTTLAKPNVRIRGKIMQPQKGFKMTLSYSERTPSDVKDNQLITPVNTDSTFEYRLHVDDLLYVGLAHKEQQRFCLLPGDDLYIVFDHYLPGGMKVTGIGADNVNFMLKKFAFEEKNKLLERDIKRTVLSLNPVTDSAQIEQLLEQKYQQKQNFIRQNKNQISPIVFQSCYWDVLIELYEMSEAVKHKQELWFRKKGTKYTKGFFKLSESAGDPIHPDNDMMCYATNYRNFILDYMHGYFTRRLDELSGNSISMSSPKDFVEKGVLNSYYSIADLHFSGLTQYNLKYLDIQNGQNTRSWDKLEQYHTDFMNSYPFSQFAGEIRRENQRIQTTKYGEIAPKIKGKTFRGKRISTRKLKGKPLLILFHTGTNLNRFKKSLSELEISIKQGVLNVVTVNVQPVDGIPYQYLDDSPGYHLTVSERAAKQIRSSYALGNQTFDGKYFLLDRKGRFINQRYIEPTDGYSFKAAIHEAMNPIPTERQRIKKLKRQRTSGLVLLVILLVGVVNFFYRRQQISLKYRLSKLNSQKRELELTAIRAQMNPHFLYNSLNSIQNLIQKRQYDEAHRYLSNFANLIREVLNHSAQEEVSLADELQAMQNYIQLEQLRFGFEYQLKVDESIDTHSLLIPPLLLQPIIENSIIHGLAPAKGDKKLEVEIHQHEKQIVFIITDNGVGRGSARSSNARGNGKGLQFSQERLKLLSEKYRADLKLQIIDLKNGEEPIGTQVLIYWTDEE